MKQRAVSPSRGVTFSPGVYVTAKDGTDVPVARATKSDLASPPSRPSLSSTWQPSPRRTRSPRQRRVFRLGQCLRARPGGMETRASRRFRPGRDATHRTRLIPTFKGNPVQTTTSERASNRLRLISRAPLTCLERENYAILHNTAPASLTFHSVTASVSKSFKTGGEREF